MRTLSIKYCFLLLFSGLVVSNSAHASDTDLLDTYFSRGDSLRYAERYEASINYYKKGLKLCDSTSELFLKYSIRIGISYFLDGNSELATDKYGDVLHLTRNHTLNIYRAHALNNLGLVYDNQGGFEKSIEYYKKAGILYKKLQDVLMQGVVKMNIGVILKKKGQYLESLRYLTEAATNFEKNDNLFQLAEAYSNIARIQKQFGDVDKALGFYHKALQIRVKLNDKGGQASILNNLGGIYYDLGKLEDAIEYYQRALTLMSHYAVRNSGIVMHNLGRSYAKLGQTNEARKFFLQALDFKTELCDSHEIVITLTELAKFELEIGHKEQAFKYLKSSAPFLNVTKSKTKRIDNYDAWKEYYKSIGRLDSAIYYLEKSEDLKQQISNESYLKELALLQEKFESNSKDRTITSLKSNSKEKEEKIGSLSALANSLKKNLLVISVSFAFLLLLLVLLYFRQRHKIAEQKLKSEIYGIELEKRRISRDLHDTVGSSLKNVSESLNHSLQKSGDSNAGNLRQVHEKLDEIILQIIDLSHSLHSPNIEELNYSMFLQDFFFDSFHSSPIRLSLNIESEDALEALSTDAKDHIYRCLQEVIANAKQHADAHQVTVRICSGNQKLKFIISDDGKGSDNYKSKGIGIKNIRDRMEIINGSFEIRNKNESGGTTVVLSIFKPI